MTSSVTARRPVRTVPVPEQQPEQAPPPPAAVSGHVVGDVDVLTSVAKAVARENSASSEATVSVPPLPSNSSLTVSTAGLAVSVRTVSRKSSTLCSTRSAFVWPMSSCSCPSTDVATSSAGNSVSTAKNAVSAASRAGGRGRPCDDLDDQAHDPVVRVARRRARRLLRGDRRPQLRGLRLVTLVGISGSGRTLTDHRRRSGRPAAVRTGESQHPVVGTGAPRVRRGCS
jgi:hypothetical protein